MRRSDHIEASRKPHLWLIAFIGVIVPRRLRADWATKVDPMVALRHE
jgi:hypothetical protein